jgi:D-tyrosyl-tRNA(Tyr) deacylase
MRALVQRVKRCAVIIDGQPFSSIATGMLIFLGVKDGDDKSDAAYLAERCALLRIFEDAGGKMNLSLNDVQGEAMVVSQFTLYGDTRKGNRPSFSDAASPQIAEGLYEDFVHELKNKLSEKRVSTGVFRAMMDVELINDGPVTLILQKETV